jgi:hypothetical protein
MMEHGKRPTGKKNARLLAKILKGLSDFSVTTSFRE